MKAIFAADADRWITVHPNGAESTGSHVKIDENGTIKAGMGGKFNGVNIKHARVGNPRKDWAGGEYLTTKADKPDNNLPEGKKEIVIEEESRAIKTARKLHRQQRVNHAFLSDDEVAEHFKNIEEKAAKAGKELHNLKLSNRQGNQEPEIYLSFSVGSGNYGSRYTKEKGWEIRKEPGVAPPIDRNSYLSVPFSEKEKAKSLGAKWDPKKKLWYYPDDKNIPEGLKKWAQDHAMDSARKKDINGWFEVNANPISRVGVFFYSGRCISPDLDPNQLYPVFRPPEELNDPECIDSFKLLPWTDDHPQRLLGDGEPAEEHGIEGVIGEKVFFDPADGMLKANIKVFSQRHADLINSGKRELSAGYHCKYEYSPGEWNGKPYQFVQRHIRGNHLASVDSGRMGPEVAVMDGFRFTIDSSELKQMKKTNQIRKVMNRLIQFAQDAEENSELEEQEKGEIETLKSLVGQAAPLMDQLAALPTIMAKTQMEEEAGEDEDPDNDLLKKAAEEATDEEEDEEKDGEGEDEDNPDDDKKKDGGSGMDAKEIKRLIFETVKACMPKTNEPAQAMDAKDLMVQISQRDTLAKQLTPFIGAFDAAEMTLADVAKYGCEKLELKAQAGAELAMLSGFLHNRQPAQPLKTFGQDKKESSWLASQTKKGE